MRHRGRRRGASGAGARHRDARARVTRHADRAHRRSPAGGAPRALPRRLLSAFRRRLRVRHRRGVRFAQSRSSRAPTAAARRSSSKDGVNGWVVRPASRHARRRARARRWRTCRWRERLGKAGLEHASHMTWDRAVQASAGAMNDDFKPGLIATAGLAVVLLAFALSVDVPEGGRRRLQGRRGDVLRARRTVSRATSISPLRTTTWCVSGRNSQGLRASSSSTARAIDIQAASAVPVRPLGEAAKIPSATHGCTSRSRSSIRWRPRRSCSCSAPTAFWCCTRCCSALTSWWSISFCTRARKSNWAALPLAAVFLAASVVPVYFVWLMPELFNFSLALYALFFWATRKSAGCAGHGAHPITPGGRRAWRADVFEADARAF